MPNETKPAENAAAEAPKKGNKMLLVVAILLALILIVGAAGLFLLLQKNNHSAVEEEEEAVEDEVVVETKKKKKKEHAPPVYVALDTFTVNLMPIDDMGDQYLQVTMSLELEDATEEANLKAHMPKLKNDITLLLSSQTASNLQTSAGKVKLAEDLRDKINMILNPPLVNRKGEVPPPDGPVISVLFTSFIVQ